MMAAMRAIMGLCVVLVAVAGCSSGGHRAVTAASPGGRVSAALAASCAAYRHFTVDVAARARRDRLVIDAAAILDPIAAYPVSMNPGVQHMFSDADTLFAYVAQAASIDLSAAQVVAVREDCELPRT